MVRQFDTPETQRILDFLAGVPIPVECTALPATTVLPGIDVRHGRLLVDPETLGWPGDLLHEAGHIAVTDPAIRETLETIPHDPGEEMATIAWSYAAALAADVDPRLVFHAAGYRGGGGWIADNFAEGRYMGVPLLQWFGMTRERSDEGLACFPAMLRWLR